MKKSDIDFTHLESALQTLKEGLQKTNLSQLERDGVIQRFEYSFELIWKLTRKVLESEGIQTDTPKSVIRELGRLGWIQDVEQWLEFLKARNKTSHEYGEKLAQSVLDASRRFYPMAMELLAILKARVRDS